MRMLIEKMQREKDPNYEAVQITLPKLQLSTEQIIISELQEQLIQIKVENIKVEEVSRKLENRLKKLEIEHNDKATEVERLSSRLNMPDA